MATQGLRPLVEGALLAAIAVVLVLIGVYVPFVGAVVIFMWPAPIALIEMRHGFKVSVLTVAVAGIALASLIGPVEALGLVCTFGFPGVAFGYCFRKKLNPVTTLLIGSLALLASATISFGISFFIMGVRPLDMVNELRSALETSVAFYRKMGVPDDTIANMENMFKGAMEVLKVAFPALFLLAGLVNSLINFEVLRSILVRMGYAIEDIPAFAEWRFPPYLGGFLIAGLILLGAKNILGNEVLYNIGLNLYSVCSMLFMVQGISIGYYFLRKYGLSKVFAIIILGFAVMNPWLGQVAVWFGLLDLVFDYRKIKTRDAY